MKNELWRLARKPTQGWPVLEDFRWCEEAPPEPAVNQILTRTVYLSLDPYQWGGGAVVWKHPEMSVMAHSGLG